MPRSSAKLCPQGRPVQILVRMRIPLHGAQGGLGKSGAALLPLWMPTLAGLTSLTSITFRVRDPIARRAPPPPRHAHSVQRPPKTR